MMHHRHGETSAQMDAIEQDIERTRARMGATVEALGERLNPTLLKQQVKDNIREATIGRVQTMAYNARDRVAEGGRGLIATLRKNPIPAAMIVGGLGWLLFARRGGSEADIEPSDNPEPIVAGSDATWSENAHGSLEAAEAGELQPAGDAGRGIAAGAAHKVAHTATSAAHRVADTAASAAHKVTGVASGAAHRVSSGVQSAARGVATQARSQTRRVADSFESNPLVLGALAAGVGLAVGMSLPSTDREARLMGEKRDELLEKARERVSETREKVISAAERVVPEVKNTIEEVVREEIQA